MLRASFLRLITSLVLLCTSVSAVACQEKERRPSRYLIPEGYVGWVRINYKVKDAPRIPIEDGHYLFKFPESGSIDTSSDNEEGWAKDEYYYYSDDRRRQLPHEIDNEMIWGHIIGGKTSRGQEPTKYEEFFVGTEEEYQKYGVKHKDSELNPIIGPIDKRLYETRETSPPSANRH